MGTYSHRKTRGPPTFVSDIQDGCSNRREVPLLLSAQDRGSHHWSCKSGKFSIIYSFVIIIIIIAVTISIIINISLNFNIQFQGWSSSLCSYCSTTTITITTILTTTTIKMIIIIASKIGALLGVLGSGMSLGGLSVVASGVLEDLDLEDQQLQQVTLVGE